MYSVYFVYFVYFSILYLVYWVFLVCRDLMYWVHRVHLPIQFNSIQSHPSGQSYSIPSNSNQVKHIQLNPIRVNPIQFTAIQSNPIPSNPIPFQSNLTASNASNSTLFSHCGLPYFPLWAALFGCSSSCFSCPVKPLRSQSCGCIARCPAWISTRLAITSSHAQNRTK